MKFKFFTVKKIPVFISIALVFLCVSSFSYWFYQIGQFDRHIQTLSWVVASKKIVIDPGHGGIFPGKVGKNGLIEKDINLAISEKLAGILSESGAMVIMTRNKDTDLVNPDLQGRFLAKQRSDLENRVKMANDYSADLYISIHCNSTPSERWTGAQTFYDENNKAGEVLAKSIQNQIVKQLRNTKREALIRKNTFLFEQLQIPTVIIECGFISNPNEAKLLSQEEYQYRMAYAIYSGLVKYLAGEVSEVSEPVR
ncbi:MAG: N-acetylmuramoyl-L-alanine amidase CwlD [Peptococcaceae bacterium]